MLARMNFASALAANQKFNLATAAAGVAQQLARASSITCVGPAHGRSRRNDVYDDLVAYAACGRGVDRIGCAAAGEGAGPRAPDPRIGGVSVRVAEARMRRMAIPDASS